MTEPLSTVSSPILSDPQKTLGQAGTWLGAYWPIAGAYDECVDETGAVRPAWRDAVERWGAREADDHQARHQAADRYLRETGVAHRVYGADHSVERPWPLSHFPLIVGEQDWAQLETGLIQRAELLEAVLADLYGRQTLVRDGHIPASLVAGAPDFLRPMVGVTPRGGHHLHFIAVELGRGPDGRWWVLGDRTQAPSGAGYALENRIAAQRSMGADLRALNVQRIAQFFQTFRDTLSALRAPGSTRVGLLTPGPYNETYYEQTLLARYLGFLLLEGGDLIHRDDAIYVRTVRGLKRIDVLWRRLDAAFCDPVELLPQSQLGVAGLVQSIRAGSLTCANSLGAGLMEARGFMAFMPQLAMHVLGEPLILPNIATWWRGDASMREAAEKSGVDTRRLSAFGRGLPMDGTATRGDRPQHDGPAGEVDQEVVRLSTMPTLDPDTETAPLALRPRPFSLRLFLARTPDGWQVMPGGFCRVAETEDTRAPSMQAGSRSADVWVRADGPVKSVTLLSQVGQRQIRRVPGTLPARAADNLFWLGRYSERAQIALRLARALLTRRTEAVQANDPAVAALEDQLEAWGCDTTRGDGALIDALMINLERAHGAASAIRDRFSPDAWKSLNGFVRQTRTATPTTNAPGDPLMDIETALTMLAAFAGLIGENMTRLSGWRFLEIGRRLERAIGTAQICQRVALAASSPPDRASVGLDLLLEITDTVMSYRRRYAVTTDTLTVLDLVVLDPNNPRSIAFQLEKIHDHVNEITNHHAFEESTPLQRMSFRLWSTVHATRAEDVTEDRLSWLQTELLALSDSVSDTFIRPSDPFEASFE